MKVIPAVLAGAVLFGAVAGVTATAATAEPLAEHAVGAGTDAAVACRPLLMGLALRCLQGADRPRQVRVALAEVAQ
jgi:hypothetical protein